MFLENRCENRTHFVYFLGNIKYLLASLIYEDSSIILG